MQKCIECGHEQPEHCLICEQCGKELTRKIEIIKKYDIPRVSKEFEHPILHTFELIDLKQSLLSNPLQMSRPQVPYGTAYVSKPDWEESVSNSYPCGKMKPDWDEQHQPKIVNPVLSQFDKLCRTFSHPKYTNCDHVTHFREYTGIPWFVLRLIRHRVSKDPDGCHGRLEMGHHDDILICRICLLLRFYRAPERITYWNNGRKKYLRIYY